MAQGATAPYFYALWRYKNGSPEGVPFGKISSAGALEELKILPYLVWQNEISEKKGYIQMASVKKFAETAVVNILRHNDRTIREPSNKDIDPKLTKLNYSLTPDRNISSYDYYKRRKSKLYCYNRKDVKVLAGWVVTTPKDLNSADRLDFFKETYNFLADRYGENNVIQAIVHRDESGQDHLHFNFIPAVPDTNPKHQQSEKICANNLINKRELCKFHPDLQKHLKEKGITTNIMSGVTKSQGGNRNVKELKHERDVSKKERVFGSKDREKERIF